MTKIILLTISGHQTFEDLTPEEAEQLIEEIEIREGKRYFVYDTENETILKEIKLLPNQTVALVPVIGGG